jgi:hypothetical protein
MYRPVDGCSTIPWLLTVSFSGRPPRPDERRGRRPSPSARGAYPLTHHGPLERLLGSTHTSVKGQYLNVGANLSNSRIFPKDLAHGSVRCSARYECRMRRNVVNACQLCVNLSTKRRCEAPNSVLGCRYDLRQHLRRFRSRTWHGGQFSRGLEYDVKGPGGSMLRIEVTECGVRCRFARLQRQDRY